MLLQQPQWPTLNPVHCAYSSHAYRMIATAQMAWQLLIPEAIALLQLSSLPATHRSPFI